MFSEDLLSEGIVRLLTVSNHFDDPYVQTVYCWYSTAAAVITGCFFISRISRFPGFVILRIHSQLTTYIVALNI